MGLDVDTLYGQLLRRMPNKDDETIYGVVVPASAALVALRVPKRVRTLLNSAVYFVSESGIVTRAD